MITKHIWTVYYTNNCPAEEYHRPGRGQHLDHQVRRAKSFSLVFLTALPLYGFRRERKTPTVYVSYSRNSTERTIDNQHNSPTNITTMVSRLPFLLRGIYGCTQSDTGDLFQRGQLRALYLGFIYIITIICLVSLIVLLLVILTNRSPTVNNGGQNSIHLRQWVPILHYYIKNNY